LPGQRKETLERERTRDLAPGERKKVQGRTPFGGRGGKKGERWALILRRDAEEEKKEHKKKYPNRGGERKKKKKKKKRRGTRRSCFFLSPWHDRGKGKRKHKEGKLRGKKNSIKHCIEFGGRKKKKGIKSAVLPTGNEGKGKGDALFLIPPSTGEGGEKKRKKNLKTGPLRPNN